MNQGHIYGKIKQWNIWEISIFLKKSKSCILCYRNVFQNSNLDWKTICMLPRIVTKDTRLRVFQYKLLNNVLYLNKMLFRFGKVDSLLCSFCKMIDETPVYLFYNCTETKLLWDQLKEFNTYQTLSIPSLMPQCTILGNIDLSDDYLLINNLILIYKFYI